MSTLSTVFIFRQKMITRWNHWLPLSIWITSILNHNFSTIFPFSSITTKRSTMQIFKKIILKHNASIVWWLILKKFKISYVHLVNVQGPVDWSILSVWFNGINIKSREPKIKDALSITFKSFFAKFVKMNTLNS